MLHIAIAGSPEGAANFVAAFDALGASARDVLEETDFSAYDALVLPGGADIDPALFGEEINGSRKIEPERDRRQLEILQLFLEADKPILGVCKGHQLINVAFGGKISQNIPEFETHQWIQADQAHESRCLPDCFLAKLYGTEFPINSAHHQAAGKLGAGLIPLCVSDDGINEGFIHENGKVIGVQFHPERIGFAHRRPDAVNGEKLFRYFLGLI